MPLDTHPVAVGQSVSFDGPEPIGGANSVGGLSANSANNASASHAEATLWESETLTPAQLQRNVNFHFNFALLMGGDGNVTNAFTLQWVENDGTVVDILEITQVTVNGTTGGVLIDALLRVLTPDAAAGKFVGVIGIRQSITGIACVATPATGQPTNVDLTQAGHFRLTSDFSGTHAQALATLLAASLVTTGRAGLTS